MRVAGRADGYLERMMTYDEGLAERIRDLFQLDPDVTEMKMFGGLAFLSGG